MTGPNLIIQIPCFNEAANLGITLASLPRAVPGFARVEWMIIDDGSTDQTIAVAKAAGVDHIVRLGHNQLAAAQPGVAAECAEPSTDHRRGIEPGTLEHQGDHRRRARLAVRARYGDREAEAH